MEFLTANVGQIWNDIWSMRLSEVDGSVLTIGTLISALLIFVVGFISLRWLTSMIDRRILVHFEIQPTLRFSLKTFLFYFLLFFLLLITFQLMQIPLTAFTLAGGALAIGIGFGSQTVISNFISGLIVMMEKPIRIGDFIEMDSLAGRVERIGARSVLIRSSEDTWHVVPNNFFLEKSFLNWTLSDDIIRAKITVRLAHSGDPEKVRTILFDETRDVPGVMKERPPQVVFESIGEHALQFDIYFWVHASTPMQRRKMESDVRFRVFAAFRREKIDFPFPQSDVHFYPERSLKVEITRP